MSVEVGISSGGDVFVFLAPKDNPSLPVMRVEPEFLHLSPPSRRSGTASGIVYACLPVRISKEDWISYAPTKSVASRYEVCARGNSTVLMHNGFIGGSSDSSYLKLLAFHDFKLAFSTALMERIDAENRHELPFRLNNLDWGKIESYCRSSWDKWVIPSFDLSGRRDPVWLANDAELKRRFGLNGRSVSELDALSRVNDAVDRISRIPKPKPLPSDPFRLSEEFMITYIGEAGCVSEEEIEDHRDAVGETFEFDSKEWTITEAFSPISSDDGWLFEVLSEDGFTSGIDERDLTSIRSDSNRARPMWTPMHRRYFFQSRLRGKDVGQKVLSKEYWDGTYRVSIYEVIREGDTKRFDRVESYEWELWRKRNALQALKDKEKEQRATLREQERKKKSRRLSALSKLAKNSKQKEAKRRSEEASNNSLSKLRKLKRLANGS